MNPVSIPAAFARLFPRADPTDAANALRRAMATPPRVYHTEAHIEAVLSCLREWTKGNPSAPLVVAALYHDAVYDATRTDNEERSADFCRAEIARLGGAEGVVNVATALILRTKTHAPADTPLVALLLDADLYVLGAELEEYAAYVRGVRAEYAHVAEEAWRTGRARVLSGFLARPRIYHGDWHGVVEREAAARFNLQTERSVLQ